MKLPRLFTADGKSIPLARRIGKGGEGEVYTVANDDKIVVKYYTLKDLESRRLKVEAMIAAGYAASTPLIAFPQAVVTNDKGQFAGFSMMRISSHEPIHEVYSPASRRVHFPKADYRFLTRVATNVARAIAAVHQTPCVIGDINHSGILVSDKATVTLIDADSFQLVTDGQSHLCRVGVPDFTPPELHGQRLDQVVRTQNHDQFGLAVLIFQLLFMGKHPFSGRYSGGDIPLEKSIEQMRFAYSLQRSVGMTPPPAAPLLDEFPPGVQNAFEAAFGPTGLTRRPKASEWVHILADLEQGLKTCASDALHQYSAHARECPWCRMDKTQGTRLFPASNPGASRARTAAVSDLASLWRQIEAIAGPGDAPATPPLTPVNLTPSPGIEAIRQAQTLRKGLGVVAILAGLALFVAAPFAWPGSLLLAGFGLFQLNARHRDRKPIEDRRADLDARWRNALRNWQSRCDDTAFLEQKKSLLALKTELDDLPATQARRIAYYQANRQSEQLKVFLDNQWIRKDTIDGIGPAKTATLASYGIETALDVTRGAVMKVPGFGSTQAQALLAWRTRLENQFVYNPAPNAQDQRMIAAIKNETQARAAELRLRLANGVNELHTVLAETTRLRTTPDPVIQNLFVQRRQNAVDLQALDTFSPPSLPASAKAWKTIGAKLVITLLLALGLAGLVFLLVIFNYRSPESPGVSGFSASSESAPTPDPYTAFDAPVMYAVTARKAMVRQGPGTTFDIVTTLANGDNVLMLGTAKSATGEDWLVYKMLNGQLVYLHSDLAAPVTDDPPPEPVAKAPKLYKTSFPCDLAAGGIQAVICTDRALAKSDRTLAALYRSKSDELTGAAKSDFDSKHRQWLAGRSLCARMRDVKTCLSSQYQARILTLRAIPEPAMPDPPGLPASASSSSSVTYVPGDWVMPGAEEMADAYPKGALRDGVEGVVTIDCTINAIGRVTACTITRETPEGYGFGKATVDAFMKHARVKPSSPGGRLRAGEHRVIIYRWNL